MHDYEDCWPLKLVHCFQKSFWQHWDFFILKILPSFLSYFWLDITGWFWLQCEQNLNIVGTHFNVYMYRYMCWTDTSPVWYPSKNKWWLWMTLDWAVTLSTKRFALTKITPVVKMSASAATDIHPDIQILRRLLLVVGQRDVSQPIFCRD